MKKCSSCGHTKDDAEFVHPLKGTQFKTCANCLIKKSTHSSRALVEYGVQPIHDRKCNATWKLRSSKSHAESEVDTTLREHAMTLRDQGATLRDHDATLRDHEVRLTMAATSPNADLAEWMPLRDTSEVIGPGDLVEVRDCQISLKISGVGLLFVVSTAPFLTGNVPEGEALTNGCAVALIGQVPVKVVGSVAANQCLAPSGRDDGTAVATDELTLIRSMEAATATDDGSFHLVNALVNAGSEPGCASKHNRARKRRLARKKEKTHTALSDFVMLDSETNSVVEEDDSTTDVDSLASAHSCVKRLVEENSELRAKLAHRERSEHAMRGGMRLLLRETFSLLVQKIARGAAARRATARKIAAVIVLQSYARSALCLRQRRFALRCVVQLQTRARICAARTALTEERAAAAAVVIQSVARRYLVLTTTALGKHLAKHRRLAVQHERTQEQLIELHERTNKQLIELHERTKEELKLAITLRLNECSAHERTNKQLEVTKATLSNTQTFLFNECSAHERTNKQLEVTKDTLSYTQGNLSYTQVKLSKIEIELNSMSKAVKNFLNKGRDVMVAGSALGFRADDIANHNKHWKGKIAEVLEGGKFRIMMSELVESANKGIPFTMVVSADRFVSYVDRPQLASIIVV